MSFYELFKKGHQTRNKAHFASIASIAMTDGKISEDEQALLQSLATKLSVNKSDMTKIIDKNFKIQNVTAMGTIAIRPAKIRLLID